MKKLTIALTLFIICQLGFGQKAIEVKIVGSGSPIIFLPGFATPGDVWNETTQHLIGTHESHIISYAGFNGLAPIGTPWYDAVKQGLIDYVKQKKLTNVTVIGHSMGGNLAIDLAAALANQISGLILVESIPCMRELMMPGVPASNLQYDSPYNKQTLEMPDEAFSQMISGMAQNMTNDPSKAAQITAWTLASDRETYVYGYTDLLKLDLRDKLSDLSIKTLILGSSFPSKEIVVGNYEKQYVNLQNKEIVVADNSKHFIMFDQPEWLYEKVNHFLNTNEQ